MTNRKITLIADYLHYPIPVSQIEKMVISTQIFNRLHNILQNSTVFFTYPSNRTSRFSHSLGCMHIAGQIFRYGFINAEEEDKNHFLKDVYREIRNIQNLKDFKIDINLRKISLNHAFLILMKLKKESVNILMNYSIKPFCLVIW